MLPLKNIFNKNKRGFSFILLVLISLILLSYSSKSETLNIRKISYSVISPFQYFFYYVGSFFQNTFNSISQLKKSQDELDRTKKELEQYKKIIIDFNVLNNENNSLKKLLELKQSVVYDSISAEIIGRDPQKLFDILIINKGSSSGLKENMPVISYTSGKKVLVGKIVEVYPISSKILTLNNSNFSVGAVITRNNIHCIVQGDNNKPGIVKLLYIPKQYVISDQGTDYIYTSGDSLLYPQGIEIGKITKLIASPKYEIFNEASVQISVDLAKLEYVLVLKADSSDNNFKIMENSN
jgi:rod shape-determining protein MreC